MLMMFSRSSIARAHTDPSSNYEQQRTPNSPPPTYEEVMKQVLQFDIGTTEANCVNESELAGSASSAAAEKNRQRWTKQAS